MEKENITTQPASPAANEESIEQPAAAETIPAPDEEATPESAESPAEPQQPSALANLEAIRDVIVADEKARAVIAEILASLLPPAVSVQPAQPAAQPEVPKEPEKPKDRTYDLWELYRHPDDPAPAPEDVSDITDRVLRQRRPNIWDATVPLL